jgi:hypothetical protein
MADLYHHRAEKFDTFKMEHAFMKIYLLIYQQRSEKAKAKQWVLYKDQIANII